MKSGMRIGVFGLVVLSLALSLAACKKHKYQLVHVVDGPKSVDLIADRESYMGAGPQIILFRIDGEYLGATGKAGEAYRKQENEKPVKIANFDLNKTNEELARIYWDYAD